MATGHQPLQWYMAINHCNGHWPSTPAMATGHQTLQWPLAINHYNGHWPSNHCNDHKPSTSTTYYTVCSDVLYCTLFSVHSVVCICYGNYRQELQRNGLLVFHIPGCLFVHTTMLVYSAYNQVGKCTVNINFSLKILG